MERAVEMAKLCEQEPGRGDITPKVGVVIAKNNEVMVEAYRGEDPDRPGDHAEFIALGKALDRDLTGAEVFTTLEPCSRRNPPKKPCAEHLINRRVGAVYIGSYDLNPVIYRQGWRMLRDAGIALRDFPADLREQIATDNGVFLGRFQGVDEDEGEFAFDWSLNDDTLPIRTTKAEFLTGWSTAGRDSIHAYGRHDTSIAFARHAKDFAEIDDPGAFPFNNHSASPSPGVGDVVIFKSGEAFLLVKVLEIHAGPKWGADHFELRAEFKLKR